MRLGIFLPNWEKSHLNPIGKGAEISAPEDTKKNPCVDNFLKPKRHIRPRKYSDHISKNIVDRHSVNNNRCFVIENCKTGQLKQSFFVRTVVEWNQLDIEVVRAETVESFRDALTRCY